MATPVYHTIHNNRFWLLAQKALFWEEQKTIILSDLHLGKTGHFRKEGIAVPQSVYKHDLHVLFDIIQQYKPDQLIIAGDMFHSKMNKEVDLFARWRKDISQLYIHLIKGNHDILNNEHYAHADIAVTDCSFAMDKFCFVHDINDVGMEGQGAKSEKLNTASQAAKAVSDNREAAKTKSKRAKKNDDCETIDINRETGTVNGVANDYYYFSGHVHPGVVLRTGTRQSVCLPCYYFSKQYAVLPAFSAFTGTYPISPKKNDHVFAIMKDSVMKVKG